MFKPIKRMYDWVLHWADTKYGEPALSVIAFMEASFFPIPPDPLLLALAVGKPGRAFRFAFYCSVFSVLGGVLGYAIGLFLMDSVGFPILEMYGAMEKYEQIKALYQEYEGAAVFLAGFTPLPYKVFTIAAGAFDINFVVFVVASLASRGLRYFLIAGFVYKFGAPIKDFIEKYFEVLTVAFSVLLVGGFFLLKLFW